MERAAINKLCLLGKEFLSDLLSPLSALHWLNQAEASGQGSLFDVIHKGKTPGTHSRMEKNKQWVRTASGEYANHHHLRNVNSPDPPAKPLDTV